MTEIYSYRCDICGKTFDDEDDCEYISNPLTGDGYRRFDVSQSAEICRVFAPAEKLEISN